MTTPAKFLFTAWPFQGHVFPLIAIALVLRRRGHECAFYTGSQICRTIRDEGFEAFPFRSVDEAALDRLMQSRPAEPWRAQNALAMGRLLRRWLLDTIPQQVRDIEDIVAAWHPHVIGSDPTMWAPGLVIAEKHRLQVAVCSFMPACPLPGADVPPWGPGLPRGNGWRGRIARGLFRRSASVTAGVGRRLANAIRRDHGLPPISTPASEHMVRLPLYLVPCTREFDYGRTDLPASVHYVGPYVWNKPRAEAPTHWVAALERNRPCVHVTEGTVHVHEPLLLPAAIAGLGGLAMDVVMTTGGNRAIEEIVSTGVAENIRVERWVSHSDLLPRTDVMVTTGGAGSVLAALAHGVPLVIVPTEWDKPEIAQRVVESGAGLRLDPRRCTPSRLRDSVRTVLDDPSFRASARRIAESFAQSAGAERAADLLVGLSTEATAPRSSS